MPRPSRNETKKGRSKRGISATYLNPVCASGIIRNRWKRPNTGEQSFARFHHLPPLVSFLLFLSRSFFPLVFENSLLQEWKFGIQRTPSVCTVMLSIIRYRRFSSSSVRTVWKNANNAKYKPYPCFLYPSTTHGNQSFLISRMDHCHHLIE